MENQVNKEKLKSKAKKLKALADRGIGGEKESAIKMYKEFMEKNGLNDSDIDPSVNNRKFRVKNYDDSLILTNVILSVNPFSKPISTELFIEAELDLEDFNEVKEKFRYFIKLYRIEKELLNMAFFSKHNSFFTPDEHAQKKWRENYSENTELKKAREQAEKLKNKSEKNKPDDNKDKSSSQELEKLKKDSQIQMRNMDRFSKLVPILLEGKYVRTSKTIENKKETV